MQGYCVRTDGSEIFCVGGDCGKASEQECAEQHGWPFGEGTSTRFGLPAFVWDLYPFLDSAVSFAASPSPPLLPPNGLRQRVRDTMPESESKALKLLPRWIDQDAKPVACYFSLSL